MNIGHNDIAILTRRVENLLKRGKNDGVWSYSGASYAFKDFSYDEKGLSCVRYQIHPDRETHFQGLEDCTINAPIQYVINGVKSICGDLRGNVTLIILDPRTRKDLNILDDQDLVLTYYSLIKHDVTSLA